MFISTDVLIDVVPDRHPYANLAVQLLALDPAQPNRWTPFYQGLRRMVLHLHFYIYDLATRRRIGSRRAISYWNSMTDFEDASQVDAMRACGAQCIVVRNVKDYGQSPIPAVATQSPRRTEAYMEDFSLLNV